MSSDWQGAAGKEVRDGAKRGGRWTRSRGQGEELGARRHGPGRDGATVKRGAGPQREGGGMRAAYKNLNWFVF